jgi:putative ABC transport system substrate-binding protein
MIQRREFITLIGGAAATLPIAASAQQPGMPVVGFLGSGSREPDRVRAFLRGLLEAGYVEGQNVAIEYRWANNQQDQLAAFAGDLVRRQVAAIAVGNSTASALAAKAASATIPIVFSVGADPVQVGLVPSISRPGGNATGVYYITTALGEKRLGLLREIVPAVTLVALLINPNNATADFTTKEVQTAAAVIGQRIDVFHATNNNEIDIAFERLVRAHAGALLLSPDPLFTNRRVQIVTLAARHALPAIYTSREYSDVGGLMTYGTSLNDVARQVGSYVGRVLKGTKPSDLPVLQPTKFEFVINLQTAKTLGLNIPPGVLAAADEVIE